MLRSAVVVLCLLFLTACTAAPIPGATSSAPQPAATASGVAVPTPGKALSAKPTTPPSPRESLVLATDAAGADLLVINPADPGSPLEQRIPVGQAPWDVAVSGTRAFVSTAEGMAVVDLEERRRTSLIPYANPAGSISHGEYRPGGTGIAVSADGSTVFVAVLRADGTSVLEKMDVQDGRTVGTVEVGLRPFDILLSADGSEIYTIDHDSFSIHVINTETLAARRIEVAPFGTQGGLASWEKPHYGAIDDAGNLLLPYQGLALAVVDPASGAVSVEEMTANSHQHGTALVDDTLLVVGTGAFGNATGSPNLTVRDTASGDERILPLDRLHETVVPWVDPGTGKAYALLSGGYTRDGSWPGITVVDLETFEQRELAVPGRPQSLAVMP
ncbi:lipoprotein [Arthrobacter tumbae]|uniref:YncE family protein n=1 Tax=Arthrobacter tumbae TaxID=163874 RepID=UPI001957EAAC|nr:hypothetical protein [Arthrobacter tumbae]MBM7781353.1 hypothetical protein [Arthrobacter tumbae]